MAWLRMIDKRGGFLLDKETEQLERLAADTVGTAEAVLVERAIDGIAMVLGICGIGDGDSVFCSPLNSTTALCAIRSLGATPVFVDINPNTFNLDPYCLDYMIRRYAREKREPPKALVATDLFGLPCNYTALEELCREHEISIIEDMGGGFGGALDSRKAGSFGRFAVASFFDGAQAGEQGSDGVVFCTDPKDADVLRVLRDDGAVRQILHGDLEPEEGDGQVQAVLLEKRLEAVEEEAESRRRIAGWYRERLKGLVLVQEPGTGTTGAYTHFAVAVKDETEREHTIKVLLAEQVPSSLYCPVPLHRRDVRGEWGRVILVNAEQACRRLLLLPMNPYLSEKVVDYICQSLLKSIKNI